MIKDWYESHSMINKFKHLHYVTKAKQIDGATGEGENLRTTVKIVMEKVPITE